MEIWHYTMGGRTYHRSLGRGFIFLLRYGLWHIKHLFLIKKYVGATSKGFTFEAIQYPFSKKLWIIKGSEYLSSG